MVAGPSRLGLAFLLLPAGPAVPLVDGYALFGLPPARRAAWGAEAAPALSRLGYRAGPPLSVNLGRLALVIRPSTCPLCAEERVCYFRRPDSFFRHDDTLLLGASHNAAKHTNLLRKAARSSETYTVTRYVQKQQLQVLSCSVTTLKVPHTRCS